MLHAMLLKTYADIAKELGVAPGGEFRRAYHEVRKICYLIDLYLKQCLYVIVFVASYCILYFL